MNREDIIRMADEAKNQWPIEPDFLERFAALVASAEREACAKVCEQGEFMTFGCVAAAIRARGQA